jgi:hypothetical protein
MKVYIFVIARNTWNSDKQNTQQIGLTQLNAYDLLYRYYPNQNLVICLVPEGFDGDPQMICNQLTNQIKINNLSLDYFKVIYSENHLPGDNWRKINPTIKPPQDIGWYREEIIKGNISSLNSLDPLIIIFTLRYSEVDYPEWHKAINSKNAIFYDDNLNKLTSQNNADKKEIRIAEFKVDNNYTVLFVKENNHGADKGGINNLLSQILNQEQRKNFPKEDIYIAVHALNEYAKGKDVDGFKEEFKNRVNYICDFHHVDTSPDKEFCDLLIKFLEEVENGSPKVENTCKEIIEKIKELATKTIRKISLLKHRLMRLLGPIDTDLQALWDDAERTGRNGFDPEKWKEVCEAYKDYKWNEILCNVLEMIKESIDEIMKGFSEEKKKKANEFLALIEQSKKSIICLIVPNGSIQERFVVLTKEIKELLDDVKKGDMNWVYEKLKNKNGLNPIHEWFEELDKKLEGLI